MRIAWYAVLLRALDVRLRFVPHRWNRPLLYDGAPAGPSGAPNTALCEYALRCARLLRVAAGRGRFGERSCLRRALLLRRALIRRGASARIVYGAARSGGRIVAHAWVELGGIAIDAGEHRPFDHPGSLEYRGGREG